MLKKMVQTYVLVQANNKISQPNTVSTGPTQEFLELEMISSNFFWMSTTPYAM